MDEHNEIGDRIRTIRRRRGLSQQTTAELAGITKSYLSMVENGQRHLDSRALLDRLADALGCSVVDLTGEPYLPGHRYTADALRAIPDIQLALADCTLDDVPDQPARSLDSLAKPVRAATIAYMDRARYDLAGAGLGWLLTDLHIHAVTGRDEARQCALALLVEACVSAFGVAKNLGYPNLALLVAQRGYEAGKISGDPALLAFASQRRAQALHRVGAFRRANVVLAEAIAAVEPHADPTAPDTAAAEGAGLLHLTAALGAARAGDADQARAHLDAAAELAERTAERNTLCQHFGPANLGVWRISIGVELGEGASVYDAHASTIDAAALASADRIAMLHTDSARALAQEGGARDAEAIRLLDSADRVAPARIRQDPVARALLATLSHRARRRTWEIDSLRNRFGLVH